MWVKKPKHTNVSDPVMITCAPETIFWSLFGFSCLHSSMNEQSAQRHCWTGQRFGRQRENLRVCSAALLSSPVFTQLWGSCLAHWPRHQAIQGQRREEKYWPTLTQTQVEKSSSKEIKARGVFEWVKKSRLYGCDDCKKRGQGGL